MRINVIYSDILLIYYNIQVQFRADSSNTTLNLCNYRIVKHQKAAPSL
jgi:hypothetical protein